MRPLVAGKHPLPLGGGGGQGEINLKKHLLSFE
ncbi:hypothetical protein MFUM_680003 [Methylacidiphilum fumariolicum SolV]|uniref:Uncharacterized protein n=2 Tax=Candidatus Methylacidiphilum fumarolicum TaxID=591154 RepID=I0JYL7_METFB|nr:conserved protein of unknown function [Candidatus Methylacidiphilum fumarolicum]CCG92336.1 hypothetical protein MFUM_680003 [Methylacidiphilum fumariolicum SolV]